MSEAGASGTERLQKEIAYYKKRLDELAGEILKLDYSVSGLRHELKQKKQGFALLSELHLSIGSQQEISAIFDTVIHAINHTLGMDKTVILEPAGAEGVFRPKHCLGFAKEIEEQILTLSLNLPAEYVQGNGILVVNKATESTSLIEAIQKALDLPYFVGLAIKVDSVPIAFLVSGRLREAKPLFPPLDQGDVDTFQSISGLISAHVRNMRVVALEEMDRLKTTFFANISHEFRTPITLTIGPLEGLLTGRYGALDERTRAQVEIMLRNQHRLLDLINQILDLAKLESGKMEVKASRCPDINAFVLERVQPFHSLAEKRGLQLKTALDPAASQAEIYIDAEKIDKVIFNLLSNAHKFTRSGSIEVKSSVSAGNFVLTVQDTGVGIRADQLPHIFDRFKQADGSASREYAGTGIGLSLVKEMVELHQGRIEVSSQYGKGTCFTVSLPLGFAHLDPTSIVASSEALEVDSAAKSTVIDVREGVALEEELAEIAKLNAETRAALSKSRPTILYADDNRDLRTYVHGLLSQDCNVFLAPNGAEGLKLALGQELDLILSDLMMPVMDGTEFLRKARERTELAAVPFVLLTAKSGTDSRLEGLEKGADDYLNKPFSEAELRARVKNLVNARRQHLRLKRELKAARALQQSLLPVAELQGKGFSLEALYHPCEDLSGDFYDFVEVGDWAYFYLADVTSHGTVAAQVTYLLKGLFRELVDREPGASIPRLLATLGKKYAGFGIEQNVAIQVMRFSRSTRTLEYATSAAPKAVRVGGEGPQIIKVDTAPILEGRGADADYDESRFAAVSHALGAGECVYFFTDGCYELRPRPGKPKFSHASFAKVLPVGGASAWKKELFAKLVELNGGERFEDDLTVLRLGVQS